MQMPKKTLSRLDSNYLDSIISFACVTFYIAKRYMQTNNIISMYINYFLDSIEL